MADTHERRPGPQDLPATARQHQRRNRRSRKPQGSPYAAPAGDDLARRLSELMDADGKFVPPEPAAPATPPYPARPPQGEAWPADPDPAQQAQAAPEWALPGGGPRWVHTRQQAPAWKRMGSRVAPFAAVVALAMLYPAYEYVLNSAPPVPLPERRPATAQVALASSGAAPVRESEAVRVPQPSAAPAPAPAQETAPAPVPASPPATDGTQVRTQKVVTIPVEQQQPRPQAQPEPQPQQPPIRQQISAEEEKAMLTRGREMMKQGDVAGARLAYRHLAENGSATGAFELARTFDPEHFERLSVVGMVPDPEEAQRWYRIAAELGSSEASRHLARQ